MASNKVPPLQHEIRIKEDLLAFEDMKKQMVNGTMTTDDPKLCSELIDKLIETLYAFDATADRLIWELGFADIEGHCLIMTESGLDVIPISNDEH